MKWSKKGGNWRAMDGDNQFVIERKADDNFSVRLKTGYTNWVHHNGIPSLEDAKSICESVNIDVTKQVLKIKDYYQRLKNRVDKLNTMPEEDKRILKAFAEYKKAPFAVRAILKNSHPNTLKVFEALEEAGVDPNHQIY